MVSAVLNSAYGFATDGCMMGDTLLTRIGEEMYQSKCVNLAVHIGVYAAAYFLCGAACAAGTGGMVLYGAVTAVCLGLSLVDETKLDVKNRKRLLFITGALISAASTHAMYACAQAANVQYALYLQQRKEFVFGEIETSLRNAGISPLSPLYKTCFSSALELYEGFGDSILPIAIRNINQVAGELYMKAIYFGLSASTISILSMMGVTLENTLE